MEVKIRHRSRLMQLIALAMFLTLVWAYAQLEWGCRRESRRPPCSRAARSSPPTAASWRAA